LSAALSFWLTGKRETQTPGLTVSARGSRIRYAMRSGLENWPQAPKENAVSILPVLACAGKCLLGQVLGLALKWVASRLEKPTMSESELRLLTMGEVAREIGRGCQSWQVARIFERGLLPAAMRIGRYRVVRADQVPEIRRVLEEARYIK
jgi:hypothetical protein